jgi:uncharacterized protein
MDKIMVTKAGGAFGIITAFVAYYAGASQLITKESSYVPSLVSKSPSDDWRLSQLR